MAIFVVNAAVVASESMAALREPVLCTHPSTQAESPNIILRLRMCSVT